MKYVGYITKGLEEVGLLELKHKFQSIKVSEVKNKRIVFDVEENTINTNLLTELKTIDDIGILLGEVEKFNSLDQISDLIKIADLSTLLNYLQHIRKSFRQNYSLTISLSGCLFSPQEVEQAVIKVVQEKYDWEYSEKDRTNFDIRVFVDRDEALLSVRLTEESLHHRAYKTDSKEGSLRPTVAAAMLVFATNFKTNLKVVDSFCGSGTILCEALLSGNEVFGGDIDAKSVDITRKNLSNLNNLYLSNIKDSNATKTNWKTGYFDVAISNLPWNKQVEVESITKLYEGCIKEYSRILKPDGSLCCLVSNPEMFTKFIRKYMPKKSIKTLKIGLLGQNPTIVLAN